MIRPTKTAMPKRLASRVRNWVTQVADPAWAVQGLAGYARYFLDWRRYQKMPGAEPIHWADAYPQVHDRTPTSPFDAHYFYVNGWAMRRVTATGPRLHVDIASQVIFSNLLGAVLPVVFVDYRRLEAKLTGVQCMGGNLLGLPFASNSIESLSCLHIIEHIGLGRYGDPLNPYGSKIALQELSRVLAPAGNLYLATPVGQPRLCFNAHRIHATETIRELLSELELVEFSGIHDNGNYVEKAELATFRNSHYACGLFWFRKPDG